MKKNLMLSGVCTILHSLVVPTFILIFMTLALMGVSLKMFKDKLE